LDSTWCRNSEPKLWVISFVVWSVRTKASNSLMLIWRAICEFYVAVFRIADDLHALRQQDEAQRRGQQPG